MNIVLGCYLSCRTMFIFGVTEAPSMPEDKYTKKLPKGRAPLRENETAIMVQKPSGSVLSVRPRS